MMCEHVTEYNSVKNMRQLDITKTKQPIINMTYLVNITNKLSGGWF